MRDPLQGRYGLHQGITEHLEGANVQAQRILYSSKEATIKEREIITESQCNSHCYIANISASWTSKDKVA